MNHTLCKRPRTVRTFTSSPMSNLGAEEVEGWQTASGAATSAGAGRSEGWQAASGGPATHTHISMHALPRHSFSAELRSCSARCEGRHISASETVGIRADAWRQKRRRNSMDANPDVLHRQPTQLRLWRPPQEQRPWPPQLACPHRCLPGRPPGGEHQMGRISLMFPTARGSEAGRPKPLPKVAHRKIT